MELVSQTVTQLWTSRLRDCESLCVCANWRFSVLLHASDACRHFNRSYS